MPSRVQQLVLGLSTSKQADIATAAATFMRFRKLDTTITSPKPTFENDAPEIGKGHEFATQTFPSHYDVQNRIEKYASAEFLTWAWAYALGNVAVTGPTGTTTTGNTTSASTAVSVTSATGITVGETISGTGIPAGTTVTAINGLNLTISQAATATGSGVNLTFGSTYSYTITPIDPGTTLELPYFSIVEQVGEGGGESIDNLYIGCALEEVQYQFNYGPGRASSKCNIQWIGSGKLTQPSGITVPALIPETNILAAGMSLTVNGVDYVSSKRILSGTIGWKNNLMEKQGFFPGSGKQNGLQIRGRLEIGVRVPTFQFTTRLLLNSPEYANLVSQSLGAATLTIPYDADNTATFTFPKVALMDVENTDADGLVAVTVGALPEYDTVTSTVMSVTTKCSVAGIAQ